MTVDGRTDAYVLGAGCSGYGMVPRSTSVSHKVVLEA
jgi:hypothetical protein